jgi:hypothetical protein
MAGEALVAVDRFANGKFLGGPTSPTSPMASCSSSSPDRWRSEPQTVQLVTLMIALRFVR